MEMNCDKCAQYWPEKLRKYISEKKGNKGELKGVVLYCPNCPGSINEKLKKEGEEVTWVK